MPFPFALGVVDVVYAALGPVEERARLARDDGFAHIDPLVDTATHCVYGVADTAN